MSNDTLKQYLFLIVISILAITLCWQLAPYIPGILAAVTLYILLRPYYFKLTVIKNWKRWLAATVFLIAILIVIVLPLWLISQLLLPRIYSFINNPGKLNQSLATVVSQVKHIIPQVSTEELQIKDLMKKAAGALPTLLGATIDVLINTILAFFILYFMLIEGRVMERQIQRFLPLKGENIDSIWEATRVMVVSNAIGLPLLAVCEGATAAIGYYLFNIEEPLLWGVITGIVSLVPVVGTAVVWVPLSLYLFAEGHTGSALGLMIFSMFIIGLDHVLRFTLLKKIGNVHPVITVIGILIGVPLFGIMGLIFGPLLVSYLLLLIEIYSVEFSPRKNNQ